MLPRRALVVIATFLLAFLLYVDRGYISIAAALNALAIVLWLGAGPGWKLPDPKPQLVQPSFA